MPAELKTELLLELTAELEPAQLVGQTPSGARLIFYVKGGSFIGPKLKGEVLPGGGDWALYRPDGVILLDVRATLRTDDSALIYISYRGIFDVAPDILQRIQKGEDVDPSEYYFRTTPVFETSAERYRWLNRIVSVGVGRRTPTGVNYTIYAVQ
jgi:Protein of unknown function (DUF3237)